MIQSEALQLIQRYSRSYFHADSAAGWFDANEHGNRIADRACPGTRVPIAGGRELASAMVDNVRAARDALTSTASRVREARADGLFDRDAMAGLPRRLKEEWLEAVATVKGDYSRAVAELRHWQEYGEQAATMPTLSAPVPIGQLARELAEAKSAPDLDSHNDDAEVPF